MFGLIWLFALTGSTSNKNEYASQEDLEFQQLIPSVNFEGLRRKGTLVSQNLRHVYYRYRYGNIELMFRHTQGSLREAQEKSIKEAEMIKYFRFSPGIIKVRKYFNDEKRVTAVVKNYLSSYDEFLPLMSSLGVVIRLRMYLKLITTVNEINAKKYVVRLEPTNLVVKLLPQPQILIRDLYQIKKAGTEILREKSIYSFCSMTSQAYVDGCQKLDTYWNLLILIAASEIGSDNAFSQAFQTLDRSTLISPQNYVNVFLKAVDEFLQRFDMKCFLRNQLKLFVEDKNKIFIKTLMTDLQEELIKYSSRS